MKEPVRKYVYSVLVSLAAVLVGYGLVSGEEVALWLALAETVLVVPVEIARSKVTPTE